MNREHAMDVARFRAGFEPLHATTAVGADGDIDEEDLLQQPRPGVAPWLFGLVIEEVRLLSVGKLSG
jgi:hypothetical protein